MIVPMVLYMETWKYILSINTHLPVIIIFKYQIKSTILNITINHKYPTKILSVYISSDRSYRYLNSPAPSYTAPFSNPDLPTNSPISVLPFSLSQKSGAEACP